MLELGTARQAGRQVVQALYGNQEDISTGSFTGVGRVGSSEREGNKESREVERSRCVDR